MENKSDTESIDSENYNRNKFAEQNKILDDYDDD